ncbi:Sugar-tr domain containing protein [Pyrenophora tritici-repentis]|nr:Sugar-tr domain containing protein [Pyrenophora tritici-repentis]
MTPITPKPHDDSVHANDEKQPQQSHSETITSASISKTISSTLPSASKCDPATPIFPRSASVAEATINAEHSMTLHQGIRQFPKAIAWSVVISLTLVMEGYSTILVPNLFAMDPFRRRFGDLLPNGSYEISANWQTALVNGGLAGQILGLFVTGTVAERIGWVNACWVLGQLIASIVMRGMISDMTEWSYRIPFGLQWIFPLPILVAVCFAPESPWWFIRQNRFADAKASLHRLRTKPKSVSDVEFDLVLVGTMEGMIETNDREQRMQTGTSYKDCFKGVDRRRTEITCMVWIIQILCGSTFMGFSTYFYEQAGIASSHAFTLSLAQFALGLIGVIISWALMSHFGRRTLYLSGQTLTCLFVLLIGILACIPQPRTNTTSTFTPLNWSIAALLLAFTLTYDATLGPICYALVSEMPSTRLRSKTIVLARNCYNVGGIVTNVITPRMLNPTAWGWGAKTGFFWAGTSVLGLGWSFWRLPEPKGRTFGELDELFERGVAAREFGGWAAGDKSSVEGEGGVKEGV